MLQCHNLRVDRGYYTGDIAQAVVSISQRVETAGVSGSSGHSPLVVVTEEYSDLFLRSWRVRPLFSAINSLSTHGHGV